MEQVLDVMRHRCETYHTMKLATLVPLRLTAIILCLASAELAKVFRSLGHNVLEQLHLDAAQFLTC